MVFSLVNAIWRFLFGVKHRAALGFRGTPTVNIMRSVTDMSQRVGDIVTTLKEDRKRLLESFEKKPSLDDFLRIKENVGTASKYLNLLFEDLDHIFHNLHQLIYQEEQSEIGEEKFLKLRIKQLLQKTKGKKGEVDAGEDSEKIRKEVESLTLRLSQVKARLLGSINDYYLASKARHNRIFNYQSAYEQHSISGNHRLRRIIRQKTIEIHSLLSAIETDKKKLHRNLNSSQSDLVSDFESELADLDAIEKAANVLYHRAQTELESLGLDVSYLLKLISTMHKSSVVPTHLSEIKEGGKTLITATQDQIGTMQKKLDAFKEHIHHLETEDIKDTQRVKVDMMQQAA